MSVSFQGALQLDLVRRVAAQLRHVPDGAATFVRYCATTPDACDDKFWIEQARLWYGRDVATGAEARRLFTRMNGDATACAVSDARYEVPHADADLYSTYAHAIAAAVDRGGCVHAYVCRANSWGPNDPENGDPPSAIIRYTLFISRSRVSEMRGDDARDPRKYLYANQISIGMNAPGMAEVARAMRGDKDMNDPDVRRDISNAIARAVRAHHDAAPEQHRIGRNMRKVLENYEYWNHRPVLDAALGEVIRGLGLL